MSFWKKLGKVIGVVVAVAAVVFAGPAIAAVAGTIGATSTVGMAAAGALYGAAAGAVSGGLWTGNSKGMVKGAAIGGLIGGAAGAVGVGSSGGAFGSGIGSSGAAAQSTTTGLNAATGAKSIPAITKAEVAASTFTPATETAAASLSPVGNSAVGGAAGGAGGAAGGGAGGSAVKQLTALEQAAQTGKYMAYAEGIKLVAGGISGAAASKDRADELKAVNAKDDENKKLRDYQPIYKSNTIFAGKKQGDETRRTFNENGLLNPMPMKVS